MHRKPSRITVAIAGVTTAAAAAVGVGVAAAMPGAPAPAVAFDHYAVHLDASQRSAAAASQANAMSAEEQAGRAVIGRASRDALAAELARAAAARRAAAAAAARRAAARAAARRAAAQAASAQTTSSQTGSAPAQPSGSPQQIAAGMLASFGWSSSQFSCLDSLWSHESGWNVSASNPSSGAYGIPQALPGSKMASAGPDWQTSAATQIKWGLGYIQSTYGSPCGAWSHEESAGWY